ncbi:helix-turn-helix domain-containing protein [Ornithinibacillus salinisoli]|uniref:Helix-turn-helix domain-containing protein n=1 Tax=Ornithinibacillus salinisoli TaxID=1848459 RepID=A0ABW4W4I0_9BACI
MDRINTLVGDRVRELRKKKGWSQEELSYEAGVHYTFVGKVERGESNLILESVVKMTKALNVSLEEFFSTIDPSIGKEKSVLNQIILLLQNKSLEDQQRLYEIIQTVDKAFGNKE